jgi:hypothetical protein
MLTLLSNYYLILHYSNKSVTVKRHRVKHFIWVVASCRKISSAVSEKRVAYISGLLNCVYVAAEATGRRKYVN